MKASIIAELTQVSSKYRVRYIKKSIEMTQWFETTYPGAALNIAVWGLFNDKEPYCTVCKTPLKFQGKFTCSYACRVIAQASSRVEISQKRKQTNLKKYGYENAVSSPAVQQKRLNTMMDKHGSFVSLATRESARARSDELNRKGRITLEERHGVSNPGQLPDHSAKIKQSLFDHYGVDSYYKSDEYIQLSTTKRYEKWQAVFPDTISLLNIDKNLVKAEVFNNPNLVLEIQCAVCNSVEKLPTETAKWRVINTGTPCYTCSGLKQGSLKQIAVCDFIGALGVRTLSNFKLDNNKQIDIFCPDYNIGFEFDGLYWHNDLRKDKKYHADKTITAKRQGIMLIHIFEDEWDHKQPIVESRIKNLLGISTSKIFARKCKVQIVDKMLEKAFINNNHIQGYARSAVAFGLFHDDILVALMSFSKPNKAKGQLLEVGHWELLRFCSALDTNVIGGASRLLARFIKDYNPEQILSFADKRWSVGKLYNALGFTQQRDTVLNYWYINIKNGLRIYRYLLRKTIEDDQSLSEHENRMKQGYLRIWDCGSSKWLLTKKSSG